MKVQFVIWPSPEQGEVLIGLAPAPLIWSSEYMLSPPATPRDSLAVGLSDSRVNPLGPSLFPLCVFLCSTVFVSLFLWLSSPSFTHSEGVALHNQCQKCHTKRVQQLALQRTREPLAKSPAVNSCLCLQGAEPGVNLAGADGDIGPVFLFPPLPLQGPCLS